MRWRVMGQGMDGGRGWAKNASTAFLRQTSPPSAESPKREGLLYIGTDDGLISGAG